MSQQTWNAQCRDDSRISTAFLSALNTFLLAHGLDVSSRCTETHEAVHALLLRCWRSSGTPAQGGHDSLHAHSADPRGHHRHIPR